MTRIILALIAAILFLTTTVACGSGNDENKDVSESQGRPEVQLQAFEFELSFPDEQVDVELSPGLGIETFICVTQDSSNSQLEGIAKIRCVVYGQEVDSPGELPIMIIDVRPKNFIEDSINEGNDDISEGSSLSGGAVLEWIVIVLAGVGIVGFVLIYRNRRNNFS